MSEAPTSQELESSFAELSEFVSLVSHEINNHLNGILLQTAILQAELPDNTGGLSVIRHLGSDSAELIRRLQRINRKACPTFGPVDLNEILRSVCREVPRIRNQTIHLQLAESEPSFIGSATILKRLLLHLLHHSGSLPPGNIRIRTEERGDQAILIVEDSGPAVPADRLPHLFDPFITVRDGADDTSLPLCNHLARRMNAGLEAENRAEGGLRFVLTLIAVSKTI
jgi:signal transduction histidine kinase